MSKLSDPSSFASALIRRLTSIHPLSSGDCDVLRQLPVTIRKFGADQDVVRQGDRPSHCCLVIAGTSAMYKITGPGRRQILNFYFPGDVPDLHSFHLKVMDAGIATLTPCTLGFIHHDAVRDICRRHSEISDAFWKLTLVDSAIFREWIVNIGQRTSAIRLAHLLCEIFLRSKAAGLAKDGVCPLPITQQELADATGISVVHVNRMLQELRESGLMNLSQRRLTVRDWGGLQVAGDFDPAYLHLLTAG